MLQTVIRGWRSAIGGIRGQLLPKSGMGSRLALESAVSIGLGRAKTESGLRVSPGGQAKKEEESATVQKDEDEREAGTIIKCERRNLRFL
jgi:hypothetical protein